MTPPEDSPGGPAARSGRVGIGFGRTWVLAGTTLTQLLRMKTLYFILIFAIIIVVASSANVFSYAPEQQLKLLKDVSLGTMSLFVSIFAIVATAMLVPRELEDRTLYTILAKPVPRHNYLLGKLLGVLLIITAAVLLMDALFCLVLYLRQSMILGSVAGTGVEMPEASPEAMAEYRERIAAAGITWNLQNAVAAILMKGFVLAGVTLLLSTIATSSLFTIIVSFVVFFIGHLQHIGREYWKHTLDDGGGGVFTRLLSGLVALLFPDFHLFDIVDGVVAGEAIPLLSMAKLAGLTTLYLAVYTLVSYFIFADKEL